MAYHLIAALLGICGLMVPADSAVIPHFDSIMLHMKSYDSPADGKSSFQVEMSEIRSIVTRATSRSLVLVDEICRGTETAKGTCIAGSIVETLDKIGCLGVVSTHLHGIFDLPLNTKKIVHKAMGTEYVDGQTRPTWKLVDGICRESLAFETAKREGIPETIIQRAEELYLQFKKDSGKVNKLSSDKIIDVPEQAHPRLSCTEAGTLHHEIESETQMEALQEKVRTAVVLLYQKQMMELYKHRNLSEIAELQCVSIGQREQPPPSTIGASVVYIMFRPDGKIYVGETDDLPGRIGSHRSMEGMQRASFFYFTVPGKSMACQLETLLINQLPKRGFRLTNIADGKHRNFGSVDLMVKNLAVHK